MQTTILLLVLLAAETIFAQGNYEQGMSKAFELWDDGNPAEASAIFESIASAEKDNWLPNYYIALVNTTDAFKPENAENVELLVSKAQNAVNIELNKDPENPELLVVQAMAYTALIAHDPMTNGQKFAGKVMELYAKAEAIAPQNPRVVFSKAQFEMGSAKFFGKDIQPICERIRQSLVLFDNFKPETPFSPKWGKEQAEAAIKDCEQ
ncbi:MAG TPA: hypothetical protein VFM59_06735 [Salinimicrobium sp.]|nr:hypothetical protein [Salinimicrobium sp.]